MTTALSTTQSALLDIADQADQAAAAHVFIDYRSRKAANTITAQDGDLTTFAEFINGIRKMTACDAAGLAVNPACWQGLTWGIVEAFVKWMLNQGYAVGTVNRKLSTVKTYAKLATKAGAISPDQYQLIKAVGGYGQKEAKRVNEHRSKTRMGPKKAEHTSISKDQAAMLKSGRLGDTPQAIRDDLLFCLLLDHGLRVGEVAGLRVEDVNLGDGTISFYRPKVDKQQTHEMTRDTLIAMREYFDGGHAPQSGVLLRGSRKGGELTDDRMSARAITKRVRAVGAELGIDNLSAHDCRHYWATSANRGGTGLFDLQDAGGWSSPSMPARYVESGKVANKNVVLG